MMAVMVAVTIPVMTLASYAQTRNCNSNNRQNRGQSRESAQYYNESPYYNDNSQYDNGQYRSGQPNVYDRHRKLANIAIGTGAGAIIGAIIGGRKGALIGAGAGAIGGIIVTKKQAPRNYNRY